MTPLDCLRAIRLTGLTQTQVSARTGIPQPTISKIERGEIEDVRSGTYLKLRALYDQLVASSSATHPRRRASDRLN